MKKKLQVFISSTFEDMKIERQQAVEAILAAGHIPAGMELFASENAEQWTVIKRWIRESDVFLILLGGRYGSIEPTSNISYIHKEFEYAVSQKKPIVSIVISDEFLQKKINDGIYNAHLPVETNDIRYIQLKKAILSRMSARYSDIGQVSSAISRIFHQNNMEQFDKCDGWVSGSDFKQEEKNIISRYSGVQSASIGLKRDYEFRDIRDRATKEIYIIGAGMSKLSRLATDSLIEQARNVPIHLYMLDPEFLENEPTIAAIYSDFFKIDEFEKHVRLAFDSLKKFCETHNMNTKGYRITLSSYRTLPTISMVMIDPGTRNAEMVVEYFSYHNGEERPLFNIKNQSKDDMFASLWKQAERLFDISEQVVI